MFDFFSSPLCANIIAIAALLIGIYKLERVSEPFGREVKGRLEYCSFSRPLHSERQQCSRRPFFIFERSQSCKRIRARYCIFRPARLQSENKRKLRTYYEKNASSGNQRGRRSSGDRFPHGQPGYSGKVRSGFSVLIRSPTSTFSSTLTPDSNSKRKSWFPSRYRKERYSVEPRLR